MEFSTIVVQFEHPETKEHYLQSILLPECEVLDIYSQMLDYDGGMIDPESSLFQLLTAVKYISKIYGFKITPNFNVLPPNDMTPVYEYRKGKKYS